MNKIVLLPTEIVESNWYLLRPYFEIALLNSDGEYGSDFILEKVLRDQAVVFVAIRNNAYAGAMAIETIDYPNKRIAFVLAIGGKHICTKEAFDEIKKWCRDNGVSSLIGYVRGARARLFRKFGLDLKYLVVGVDL